MNSKYVLLIPQLKKIYLLVGGEYNTLTASLAEGTPPHNQKGIS